MKKIIKYTILQGTAEELFRLVAEKIDQGWQPLGGVALAANRPTVGRLNCTFAQAMVRYAETATSEMSSLSDSQETATCPVCKADIPVRDIKKGINLCPKCKQQFTTE